MAVTLADVDHIAALARLGLRDDEREALRRELGAILQHIDQLRGLATDGVEPTTSVVAVAAPLRDDVVTNGDDAETLLAGAPDRDGTFFRVPKILQTS